MFEEASYKGAVRGIPRRQAWPPGASPSVPPGRTLHLNEDENGLMLQLVVRQEAVRVSFLDTCSVPLAQACTQAGTAGQRYEEVDEQLSARRAFRVGSSINRNIISVF